MNNWSNVTGKCLKIQLFFLFYDIYKMPPKFIHKEYADTMFIYGVCNVVCWFGAFLIPNRQVLVMSPSVSVVSERQHGLGLELEEDILDVIK